MLDFEEAKDRSEEVEAFLKEKKYHQYDRISLTGDASKKKFLRLQKGKKSVLLLDADPFLGEVPIAIAASTHILKKHKINVPDILEEDLEKGFFIIEDLGDMHLKTYLETQGKEKDLYADAVDILSKIHAIPVSDSIAYGDHSYKIREYSLNKLVSEARIFVDWYFPKVMGRKISSVAYDEFVMILRGLLAPIVEKNAVYTLYDYHADNIMLQEGAKKENLFLIDFQDMCTGHPAYDLVSLLQDVRRKVSKTTQDSLLKAFLKDKNYDVNDFKRAYVILGAQRAIKILGIFVRLLVRDRKDHYLVYIPYTWQLLEDNLSSPELYPLKQWFDHWVPVAMRKQSYLMDVA